MNTYKKMILGFIAVMSLQSFATESSLRCHPRDPFCEDRLVAEIARADGWRFVHWNNCTRDELARGYVNSSKLYCENHRMPESCSNRSACFRFWEPSH